MSQNFTFTSTPFFYSLASPRPAPMTQRPPSVSALSQAPALPGEAGDLGFHLADGRAVDLYAHLLLGSERLPGRHGENWEKKSATRIIGKMFIIERFSATNHENHIYIYVYVYIYICLTHCESWFSNVMIIYYDYCL